MKRLFLVLFLCLNALVPVFGGTGWIFVAPLSAVPDQPATTLAEVQTVGVRGGKAFAFREVPRGEDPRLDALRDLLASSKAWAQALEWLELARELAPAPCQEWIADEGPLPIWVVSGQAQTVSGRGPGLVSLVPLRIQRQKKSYDACRVLQVEPLQISRTVVLTPDELARSGVLLQMLCHEVFHAIQSELYRERFLYFDIFGQIAGPHDSPKETDPQMAFREGFAEAGELLLGEKFPQEFAVRGGDGQRPEAFNFAIATFKQRQILASRNRYIFSADGRVKDGQLDAGSTDLSTEGVVASLLFTLFGHAEIPGGPKGVFRSMARYAPLTLFELVNGLMRDHPDQAQTIQRIMLEYTCYTISSAEALERYQLYYLSRRAFLGGKITREEYLRVRESWQQWKDLQRRRIEGGAPLVEAVPQPLIVATRGGYTLDLNDADRDRLAWQLEAFFPAGNEADNKRLAAQYAAQISEQRTAVGLFSSVKQLEGAVPEWLLEKFEAGFRRYLAGAEQRLDKEITKRRSLSGYQR